MQLLRALGAEANTPVAVVDSSGDSLDLAPIVASLTAIDFNDVRILDAADARDRAIGPSDAAGDETGFAACPIPAGLLEAHPHLTLDDLAAPAGGALTGLGITASPSSTDAADNMVVWRPEGAEVEPEPVAVADEPDADESDRSAVAAAGAGAAAAGIVAAGAAAAGNTVASSEDVTVGNDAPNDPTVELNHDRGLAAAAATPLATQPQAAATPAVDPASIGLLDVDADQGPNRRLLPILIALLGLIGIGALAFFLFSSNDENATPAVVDPVVAPEPTAVPATPVPDPTAEPTAVPTAEPTAAPTPEPTAEPTPTPEPTAEPTPTPEPTADPLAGLPPLDQLPERGAVFIAAEQKLYLQGPVTAEEASVLEARAIEVLGPERVVNEYIIRPDAPPVTEGNVRVEQAVLFATGSAEIAEPFLPTLQLGVLVMNLNPQVTMIVEGHTDSVGSEPQNLTLSEARAQAVVDYLVGAGIERSRLIPIGFGEGTPIADNTIEAGRQLNRRIEVDLVDLLSPRPDDN